MRKLILHIAILASILALPACTTRPDDVPRERKMVSVQLGVPVGGSTAATKGNPSVITEMSETFRGIGDITVIPFDVNRKVSAAGGSDVSIFHPAYLHGIASDGLTATGNAYFYTNAEVSLPAGTSSVLAYGSTIEVPGATEVETRHLNGALTVLGLAPQATYRSAADISFSPVAIYPTGFPEEAAEMAAILNAVVASASVSVTYFYKDAGSAWQGATAAVSWEDVPEPRLKEMFQWITNRGNLITGAGVNVEYMLTYLYRFLKEYTVTQFDTQYEHVTTTMTYPAYRIQSDSDEYKFTYNDLYNALIAELTRRFEAVLRETNHDIVINSQTQAVTFTDTDHRTYPQQYGLPDGAAVLRWGGTAFAPVSEVLDGVAPLSSYCYPPRLWYFANTLLETSTKDPSESYVSGNSWSTILNLYKSGHVIHSDTKAAALQEQLQYSTALLVASVRASGSGLPDAENSPTKVSIVDITKGSGIEVTGVIIGSQRRLNFDFTPMDGQDYFLYDNCISGVPLTETPKASAPRFRTLVSQTPLNEPVYFCLELRNNTGSSFTGADGLVLPGARFYLLGSIELPTDNSFDRVFERHYATTVHCLVSSLADARTAVPDLMHPSLSVGLQVNVNWIQSTSSYIILY